MDQFISRETLDIILCEPRKFAALLLTAALILFLTTTVFTAVEETGFSVVNADA